MERTSLQNLISCVVDEPKTSAEAELEREISRLALTLEKKKAKLRRMQERTVKASLSRVFGDSFPFGSYVFDLVRNQSYIVEKGNPIEVRSVY